MEVSLEGSSNSHNISFPVSDKLLSESKSTEDGATYDAETQSATLKFSVNLLADEEFSKTYV